VSPDATVGRDERLRLFLALELPDPIAAELTRWGAAHLVRGRRLETFHVTLAFLGTRAAGDVDPIVALLRETAADAEPFELLPVAYRETRSVGMLVLDDPSGRGTSLAAELQGGLADLGLYAPEPRPWLPHVTVLRFRERPRLAPPVPDIGTFVPSGVAAFLSRLHPSGARYEALESCSLGRVR
jgi:2'-5' RNA ligase